MVANLLNVTTDVYYGALTNPVRYVDCPEIIELSAKVAFGWKSRSVQIKASEIAEPLAVVQKQGQLYSVTSSFRDSFVLSQVEAISAVMWHLAKMLYLSKPDIIPLHCGSFNLNGHLIAVSGPSGMGKSTLTARMCVEPDITIFGDDILLAQPDGIASGIGILPRLRPPLPQSASAAFREYVASSIAPADATYAYISCRNMAPFGHRGKLSALIILSRLHRAASPYFVEIDPADAFLEWINNSISANVVDFAVHADRITELSHNVPCYRLVYSDLEDVVGLFRSSCLPAQAFHPARLGQITTDPIDLTANWSAAPGIQTREIYGASFLFFSDSTSVTRLNPTSMFIFNVIKAGGSFDYIMDILSESYPNVPPAKLKDDILAAMSELCSNRLIVADTNM